MDTEPRVKKIIITYTCLAVALGVIGAMIQNRTLAIICAAMLATAYLFHYYRKIRRRVVEREAKKRASTTPPQ
ncbi:MAG: hypothetical protein V1916_03590 [Patescibacteria group bacterium]